MPNLNSQWPLTYSQASIYAERKFAKIPVVRKFDTKKQYVSGYCNLKATFEFPMAANLFPLVPSQIERNCKASCQNGYSTHVNSRKHPQNVSQGPRPKFQSLLMPLASSPAKTVQKAKKYVTCGSRTSDHPIGRRTSYRYTTG